MAPFADNIYTLYDVLTITNGNVGIGTGIPTSGFHIEGTITTNALTSKVGFIDATNTSLSNVNSINVKELLINDSPLPFSGSDLNNLANVYTSNLYVDKIGTNTAANIDVNASTLSNVSVLKVATLSSDAVNVDVDGKSLSNVNALSVSALTSDGVNINVSGKSLSNLTTLFADNVVTTILTSTESNINVDGKTLSNVTEFNGEFLYVSTATISTLTSDVENIDVDTKSLSNLTTVATANVVTSKLTSTDVNIDVDTKSLSNLTTVATANVVTSKLTSTGTNIDVDSKTLSNVSLLSGTTAHLSTVNVATLTSDVDNINVNTKSLSNITTVYTTNAVLDVLTSTGVNINVDTKSLSNITTVATSTVSTSMLTSTEDNINVDAKSLSNMESLTVHKIRSDGLSVDFLSKVTTTEDVQVGGTLFASNLQIIGEFTTLNTTTSNTEQLVVNNAGTGPALKVIQTGSGAQYSIAEFVDNEDGVALRIQDTGLIGIGTDSVASRLGVSGGVTIGADYNMVTAPTDSLIVSGQVGVGVTNPASKMGVSGGVSVGSSYATVEAPSDGLIVSGNVGIGVTVPTAALDILGDMNATGLLKQVRTATRFVQAIGSADFASTGDQYIGFTIEWANTTADQIYAFKMNTKLHFTSDTNATFTSIESVVTPVDGDPKPNGLLIGAPQTTSLNTNDFKNIVMTITRASSKSVTVKVNFTNNLSPATAFMMVEIVAPTALGDFTMTPISGAQ
jgi:hypothetical protein